MSRLEFDDDDCDGDGVACLHIICYRFRNHCESWSVFILNRHQISLKSTTIINSYY